MKKIALIIALLTPYLYGESTPIASRSFMYIRPIFQNLGLDKNAWDTLFFQQGSTQAIQVTGFFQKAFRPDLISQFFLPEHRKALYVDSTSLNRDVNPYWIGLPTNFSGFLELHPTYSSYGVRIEARKKVGELLKLPFFKETWVEISAPVTVNKQNINLTQYDVQNPGNPETDPVYDIVTAFNNPTWLFDKMAHRPTKVALSELRVGYGTTLLADGRAHAVTYTSLSIPTYKKPDNEYLFNPQIGNDGHLGVIWGITMQVPINRTSDSYQVNLHFDLENNYLLKGHRYRTFDLFSNDPLHPDSNWSRFLLLRKNTDTLDIKIPAVNILTQKVMVAPHSTVDFAFGIKVNANDFEGEIGIGAWAFTGDKVRYTGQWQDIYGIAGSIPLTTASNSTISTIAPDDATFVPIQLSDINFQSGAMPSVLVYKSFANLAYAHKGKDRDLYVSIGGFGEAAVNKTKALCMYGLYGKAGIGF